MKLLRLPSVRVFRGSPQLVHDADARRYKELEGTQQGSQKEVAGSVHSLKPLFVVCVFSVFACSPCVCSLQVPQLPPVVQQRACEKN